MFFPLVSEGAAVIASILRQTGIQACPQHRRPSGSTESGVLAALEHLFVFGSRPLGSHTNLKPQTLKVLVGASWRRGSFCAARPFNKALRSFEKESGISMTLAANDEPGSDKAFGITGYHRIDCFPWLCRRPRDAEAPMARWS